MHAERDHLAKVVFPELRERMAEHSLQLVDLDLRSGLSQISGNQLQLNPSITPSISLDLNSDNTIVQIHDDHSACTPTG